VNDEQVVADRRTIHNAARAHKRALLRRMDKRAGELDVTAAVFLDLLCRALGKVTQLDAWYAEHGIIKPNGEGQATLTVYLAALNSARLSAQRLSDHLARQNGGSEPSLDDYISATYSRTNGDDTGAGE
jgi:hypothetical protein